MRVLRFSGDRDFLHRVTAGPVKFLRNGQGAGGVLLTGQSRMIAQFDLLCADEKEFLLVSPESCFAALLEGLERLHFAEEISLQAGAYAGVRVVANSDPRDPIFSFCEKKWPAPVPGYECFLSETPVPFPAAWNFDRIGAGVPWPPLDWDCATPALEAGVLPWIDRHKGCYPGQEVVELSLNVGHPARVLVAWEGKAALSPGEKISLPEGGEGLVASSAEWEGNTRALVRVPWAKRGTPAAGFRILPSPLGASW